jgi:hypothetical protein
MSQGVTEEGLLDTFNILTDRSRENLRRQGIEIIDETPAIDFDRYKQIPGAITHPDGVIELPTYERVRARIADGINTEPDRWFRTNYYDTSSLLDVYEEFDFGRRITSMGPEFIKTVIADRYNEDHAD